MTPCSHCSKTGLMIVIVRLPPPQNIWLFLTIPIFGFLLPFFLYHNALRRGQVTAMDAGFAGDGSAAQVGGGLHICYS
jgi:hypothetical protein